ncbi:MULTISPECIES: MarR family winged helix-turn-helix transcriptional regulator [Clostridia]|uniref:MarR family winged helix-turn-helix transcriptional regulator n=1 Tax=Clostridia TaxID=186801 RepID=UPI00046785BA|nr:MULTISPECIES: MarR family transcriptional regulator [Clostridia]
MQEKLSALVNMLWQECIRNLNTVMKEDEINKFSNNDYYYLMVIHSLQMPNLTQIAEALSLTKPAVSVIIRKLLNLDLIKKMQSEEDKRVFYVELSKKGKSILQGDQAVYQWVSDTMEEIAEDEKELEVMDRMISKLVEKLEERAVGSKEIN